MIGLFLNILSITPLNTSDLCYGEDKFYGRYGCYGLSVFRASLNTGYYGFRYDKGILPETRASGSLHDVDFGLNLSAGWPLGLKSMVFYPHGDIDFKCLGFLSPGYTYWQAGLGDAHIGVTAIVKSRVTLDLKILLPTGSYCNRLGEGRFCGSAGLGFLLGRFSTGLSLLWTGMNPDGVDAGDGASFSAACNLPDDWILSSVLSACLPDRGGPFDPQDSPTFDLRAEVSKRWPLGSHWAVELNLEQTLWGIDTEVWTTLSLGVLRTRE